MVWMDLALAVVAIVWVPVILAVLVALAAFLAFRAYAKGRVLARMESGVDMVKLGLYKRLANSYAGEFSVDDAKYLAASVVNALFGEPGTEFSIKHPDLVDTKLHLLAELPTKTRQVITDALRVKAAAEFARGTKPRLEVKWENHDHLEVCGNPTSDAMNMGILIPGGSTPSYPDFLGTVEQFLEQSPGKLEEKA